MDPKKQLAELKAAMAAVVAKAEAAGRHITEAELTDLEAKAAQAAHLQKTIDIAERGSAILDRFRQGADDDGDGGSKGSFIDFKRTAQKVGTKAIGSDLTPIQFVSQIAPATNQVPTSLLRVIPFVRRDSVYTYLRNTVRTNNAAPVAEGALKPTSLYTLTPVESSLRVFAHLSEPIPHYLLADNAEIRRFLEQEFANGLDQAIQAQIVSGSGVAPNLLGWLNTSGIITVTGVDLLTTARKGIQSLTSRGLVPDFIAVAPGDWTTALTTRNTSGGFDFAPDTPVNEAQTRMWGVQVIETPAVAAGTVWVVAQGAVALSGDGQVGVRWADQVADDFEKNMVRLRVETRVNSDVYTPGGLVKGTITPA